MDMNDNTTLNDIDDLRHAYFVINATYTLTMIIGFFGNILIVSTILKNKYLRTPMNISLVSLALCDIVVCVCVLPVRLFLYSGTWGAPYIFVLCHVDVFLKSACDYLQPTMLVATSYERYKSIAKPFQSKAKMKRTVILITATWGTCMLGGAISAILLKDGATIFPCNRDIVTTLNRRVSVVNYREAYVTFPLGFSCIIAVSIFYYLMIRTLHEHTNKMKKQFKTKPFKNKVHPDAKADQTVAKEIHVDALTIQPLVVEKSEVNVSDNSRQTSGTSIRTSESVKNSTDGANLNMISEKNDQLIQVKDAISNDSDEINVECNSQCQEVDDLSPSVTVRRISIKKTRDNILHPSNERSDKLRFSTIAKHVVLLKSHKRKSLKNVQNRIYKFSLNSSRKSSVVSQLTENECCNNNDDSTKEIGSGNNESVNTIECDSTNVHGETVFISKQENQEQEGENTSTPKGDNVVAESGNQSLFDDKTKPTDNDVDSISNKTKIYVETCENNLNITSSSEKVSGTNDKNDICSFTKKSDIICNISTNNGDNNEIVLPSNKEIKENKGELSGNNQGADSNEKHDAKTDASKENNKVSNVDIVDFDGTVHKDVKVEGAVVGAVCVMNKTNRLEGRRKVEMRAAKRIAVLMGSYVLLWLPLPLIALFVSSRRQISTSDIEALITSASISATTIAFNPILSLLLNKQLRSAALTLLRRAANALKRIKV